MNLLNAAGEETTFGASQILPHISASNFAISPCHSPPTRNYSHIVDIQARPHHACTRGGTTGSGFTSTKGQAVKEVGFLNTSSNPLEACVVQAILCSSSIPPASCVRWYKMAGTGPKCTNICVHHASATNCPALSPYSLHSNIALHCCHCDCRSCQPAKLPALQPTDMTLSTRGVRPSLRQQTGRCSCLRAFTPAPPLFPFKP